MSQSTKENIEILNKELKKVGQIKFEELVKM